MRIISRKRLRVFWERHKDAEGALRSWYFDVKQAQWSSPKDLQAANSTASILSDQRVVFKIKGNRYRIVVRINYAYMTMYIRFIGTHAEYDRIDANNI